MEGGGIEWHKKSRGRRARDCAGVVELECVAGGGASVGLELVMVMGLVLVMVLGLVPELVLLVVLLVLVLALVTELVLVLVLLL